MDASTTARRRKSEPLTIEERERLVAYRAGFTTEVDCAISLGIDRLVLNRVSLVGSGSPETIDKIRKVIGYGLTQEVGREDKSNTGFPHTQ